MEVVRCKFTPGFGVVCMCFDAVCVVRVVILAMVSGVVCGWSGFLRRIYGHQPRGCEGEAVVLGLLVGDPWGVGKKKRLVEGLRVIGYQPRG